MKVLRIVANDQDESIGQSLINAFSASKKKHRVMVSKKAVRVIRISIVFIYWYLYLSPSMYISPFAHHTHICTYSPECHPHLLGSWSIEIWLVHMIYVYIGDCIVHYTQSHHLWIMPIPRSPLCGCGTEWLPYLPLSPTTSSPFCSPISFFFFPYTLSSIRHSFILPSYLPRLYHAFVSKNCNYFSCRFPVTPLSFKPSLPPLAALVTSTLTPAIRNGQHLHHLHKRKAGNQICNTLGNMLCLILVQPETLRASHPNLDRMVGQTGEIAWILRLVK